MLARSAFCACSPLSVHRTSAESCSEPARAVLESEAVQASCRPSRAWSLSSSPSSHRTPTSLRTPCPASTIRLRPSATRSSRPSSSSASRRRGRGSTTGPSRVLLSRLGRSCARKARRAAPRLARTATTRARADSHSPRTSPSPLGQRNSTSVDADLAQTTARHDALLQDKVSAVHAQNEHVRPPLPFLAPRRSSPHTSREPSRATADVPPALRPPAGQGRRAAARPVRPGQRRHPGQAAHARRARPGRRAAGGRREQVSELGRPSSLRLLGSRLRETTS